MDGSKCSKIFDDENWMKLSLCFKEKVYRQLYMKCLTHSALIEMVIDNTDDMGYKYAYLWDYKDEN